MQTMILESHALFVVHMHHFVIRRHINPCPSHLTKTWVHSLCGSFYCPQSHRMFISSEYFKGTII